MAAHLPRGQQQTSRDCKLLSRMLAGQLAGRIQHAAALCMRYDMFSLVAYLCFGPSQLN